MKPNTFAPLMLSLSALLLAGCGDMAAQSTEADWLGVESLGGEAESNIARVTENGVKLNGVKLNGVKLNGVKLNGVKLNGVKLNGVKLNGSVLCGSNANGQELCGNMLEGALLTAERANGQPLELRIDAVDEDAGGEFSWHTVSYAKGNQWVSVCGEDGSGQPLRAIALSGRWDMSEGTATGGDFIDDPAMFTLACEGFVLSKCVELTGYYPWETVSEVNEAGETHTYSRRHLHQACTRMLRADYCGDGQPHTENGTLVNSWDAFGLDASEPQAGWTLEAEWSEGGAVCVHHIRDAWNGLGQIQKAEAYIQDHCPWVLNGAEACGGSQSTFYTANGFDVEADERTWVMNDSANIE